MELNKIKVRMISQPEKKILLDPDWLRHFIWSIRTKYSKHVRGEKSPEISASTVYKDYIFPADFQCLSLKF